MIRVLFYSTKADGIFTTMSEALEAEDEFDASCCDSPESELNNQLQQMDQSDLMALLTVLMQMKNNQN